MKPVKVEFINEGLDEWEKLNAVVTEETASGIKNSEKQQLLKSIKQKIERIKSNPQCGFSISKKKIPKKFPVDNLWVISLTGYWRMLYTLRGSSIEICCFILELSDHPKYDKLFGYKKR